MKGGKDKMNDRKEYLIYDLDEERYFHEAYINGSIYRIEITKEQYENWQQAGRQNEEE